MKYTFPTLLLSTLITAPAVSDQIEETYVTADFALTEVSRIPEATTVVGEEQIRDRNAEHLEQILSYAPNVNFSAGASRGRFFQIRGIGERSQFIDPINPSVGLIIDGIDLTGLGGAATLFDVQQVEILRGPQGTRFGANALAGMINIKSNDTTDELEGYVSARAGNYDSYGVGGAISGQITDGLTARAAVKTFQSDGYVENTFLNRDDTNNVDELLARIKLRYQFSENAELSLVYLRTDIDNGYEAFSLDNNRNTLSDEPGTDAQETDALALNLKTDISDAFAFQATASISQSDIEYSYDEDWTFVGIAPLLEYSSFDQYLRDYERASIDLRLSSNENGKIFSDTTDWVMGLQAMTRDEQLTRNYTFLPQFNSELDVSSTALYGEMTTRFSDSLRMITGLRIENWENDYSDNNAIAGDTDEDLVGGKIVIENMLSENQLAYLSFARGYKAGSVNSDPDVSTENRSFDTEFNNVYEFGFKSEWSAKFRTSITAFYIERRDQQVKSSYAIQNENNSFTFQEFFSNAARGTNKGIEVEGAWDINESLNWAFSLGYLDTAFSDYSFQTDDGEFNISGRQQAHAPNYTAASTLNIAISDAISLQFEVEAKDEFYFSDSHNLESDAYTLLHAQIEYKTERFRVELYGRNLTDEDYAVRGFGFPNDPRDGYTSIGYIQLGEPRQFGVSGSIHF